MSSMDDLLKIEKYLEKQFDRPLSDGIYDMTGVKYISISHLEDLESVVENFLEEHPNAVWASSYETYTHFLLSCKPPELDCSVHGSGFEGHGTTCIVEFNTKPDAILILGMND